MEETLSVLVIFQDSKLITIRRIAIDVYVLYEIARINHTIRINNVTEQNIYTKNLLNKYKKSK